MFDFCARRARQLFGIAFCLTPIFGSSATASPTVQNGRLVSTPREIRNHVFFDGGIIRPNLAPALREQIGHAMQRHLQPDEVGRIAGLAIARDIRDNLITRRLRLDGSDEIVVHEYLGPFKPFPTRYKRRLYRAMHEGQVPTARHGQIGGSWAVSAEALVTFAVREGLEIDPGVVARWYERAVGYEIASAHSLELVMHEFD